MLVVDPPEHIAGGTWNADDGWGEIGESQADDAIVTAAFHARDGEWSAETYCDAEVMDFMLESREGLLGVGVAGGYASGHWGG